MTYRYELYGLVVHSDVDLHQERVADPSRPPDLVLRHAPGHAPQEPLVGTQVLEHTRDGRTWYRAVLRPDGELVLRFDEVCDMELSADLRSVVVRLAPDGSAGFVTVLVTGALLSFVLSWRSELVLHGSAVSVAHGDGRAVVGFVGRSGMGKSTMAALLCAAGGELVTDDVLVLDDAGDGYRARPGATEVRLRAAAESLATSFAGPHVRLRRSADDRRVLRPGLPAAGRELGRVAALVVPFPDRSHDEVRVERLPPRDATVLLLRFPRLSEWSEDRVQARHFAMLADLAQRVPVCLARVPWGPPFDPDVVQALLAELLGQAPASGGQAVEPVSV